MLPVADAAARADVMMMVVPDQTQRALYEESVKPGLKPGNTLMFAHGFNIHHQARCFRRPTSTSP